MLIIITRSYLTERQVLAGVADDSIFGIIECDIQVPDHLKDEFKDFCPIIKHVDISINDVGNHMKQYCENVGILKHPRRSLIGSFYANNHLVSTDLLKWYMSIGIEVKRVHLLVQFHRSKCFERFANEIMDARREADRDPSKKIVADGMKMIGNSSYGKTIIDKEKFTNVAFYDEKDSVRISQEVNNKQFHHLSYIGGETVEIEKFHRSIVIDTPITIGFMILERSKLILLKFVHYFLKKYVAREDICLLECDTDSMYMSLSAKSLFLVVKPNMRDAFMDEYPDWFAREYCDSHKNSFFESMFNGENWIEGSSCRDCASMKLYDNRTVGKQIIIHFQND